MERGYFCRENGSSLRGLQSDQGLFCFVIMFVVISVPIHGHNFHPRGGCSELSAAAGTARGFLGNRAAETPPAAAGKESRACPALSREQRRPLGGESMSAGGCGRSTGRVHFLLLEPGGRALLWGRTVADALGILEAILLPVAFVQQQGTPPPRWLRVLVATVQGKGQIPFGAFSWLQLTHNSSAKNRFHVCPGECQAHRGA
ncbi:uncharacterized protein LOC123652833 isoform X2 [Pipistrellus kuhlii]|uniref:Uncharacterized protein n=1 Tax=Pipistrellus kuhlii TaxID=59472 RepID=A0A7J7UGE4_PIPKU|nr:uncharacterized protein LOC123652833 isoform X2 [Pipistrellus kuhlii]KAF6311874.1 hypothetical protein mPipKuh1_009072 [Pipistrellus kuhlii]